MANYATERTGATLLTLCFLRWSGARTQEARGMTTSLSQKRRFKQGVRVHDGSARFTVWMLPRAQPSSRSLRETSRQVHRAFVTSIRGESGVCLRMVRFA